MSYILDSNSLFSLPHNLRHRDDLYIVVEVNEEFASNETRRNNIRKFGIKVLQSKLKHYKMLKEVMTLHGSNQDLISLRKNKGLADVVIIAYILAERDSPDTLFPINYDLVTKDVALTDIATSYGIQCSNEII